MVAAAPCRDGRIRQGCIEPRVVKTIEPHSEGVVKAFGSLAAVSVVVAVIILMMMFVFVMLRVVVFV